MYPKRMSHELTLTSQHRHHGIERKRYLQSRPNYASSPHPLQARCAGGEAAQLVVPIRALTYPKRRVATCRQPVPPSPALLMRTDRSPLACSQLREAHAALFFTSAPPTRARSFFKANCLARALAFEAALRARSFFTSCSKTANMFSIANSSPSSAALFFAFASATARSSSSVSCTMVASNLA